MSAAGVLLDTCAVIWLANGDPMAAVAVDASWLPGGLQGDPGDRLIIATARDRGIPVLTRDTAILRYAASGHLAALAC